MSRRARRSLETRICSALTGSAGSADSDHNRSISVVAGTMRPGESSSSTSRARSAAPGSLTGSSSTSMSVEPSSLKRSVSNGPTIPEVVPSCRHAGTAATDPYAVVLCRESSVSVPPAAWGDAPGARSLEWVGPGSRRPPRPPRTAPRSR